MNITSFQARACPLRFLPPFFVLGHPTQDYDDAEHYPC